jgi:hypothetical protein
MGMAGANSNNALQMMIEKLKSKVTNPYLKNNLSIENIANFFANFISGNSFINNLEVKEITELNKVNIKESLKVKETAKIENLSFHTMENKVLTIKDNEIIFDPEAVIRMKSSKLAFKVKDIFEVITFMKYVVKICGSKLERCNFNTLLKNYNTEQTMKMINAFEKKLENEKKKEQENEEKDEKNNEKSKNLRKNNDNKDVNNTNNNPNININFKESKYINLFC